MRVSFVIRVDPAGLADGRLIGEVEEVQTGRVGGLRSFADLAEFVAATGRDLACDEATRGADGTEGGRQ